jgi:hypothetical protein
MPTVRDDSNGHHDSTLSRADWAALLLAFGLVLLVGVRWHAYQWDFYMFHGSANDFLHGISPYRGEGLSFYHTPLTLYFYALFVRLPFPVAYELWIGLKVVALSALFLLWTRRFLQLDCRWTTTLFFLFAYNGTIYSDLVSGNISTFEQLGLWFGFAALLRGRYAAFCLCVILVAQFKLTPILFALLLLIVPRRPQWTWFVVCCAGFAAVFALNFVLQPALLHDFFTVAPALDERGTLAPGTLAFVRDVIDLAGGAHYSDRTRVDELAFLSAALAVGVVSALTVVRHRLRASEPNARALIYFACLAYALMIPRMKTYSYILLLIPTLYVLRALPRRTVVAAVGAALAAIVVFPNGMSLFPFRLVSQLFYEYLPVVAAFGVWLAFVVIWKREPAGQFASPRVSDGPAWSMPMPDRP